MPGQKYKTLANTLGKEVSELLPRRSFDLQSLETATPVIPFVLFMHQFN